MHWKHCDRLGRVGAPGLPNLYRMPKAGGAGAMAISGRPQSRRGDIDFDVGLAAVEVTGQLPGQGPPAGPLGLGEAAPLGSDGLEEAAVELLRQGAWVARNDALPLDDAVRTAHEGT
jgi:hypothetical protein